MEEKISCFKCKHFYVTWDPVSPKGCRAYGFKTHEIPSQVVMRDSGHDCLSFEEKIKVKKKDPLDLNRDDFW